MKLYCFVNEDLRMEHMYKQFRLQEKYAHRLGKICYCDLRKKKITDDMGNQIDIDGKQIFLRASYTLMYEAMDLLLENGAILLEDAEAVERIERWTDLKLHQRPIRMISSETIINNDYDKCDRRYIESAKRVFLKSVTKGFSLQCTSGMLLESDSNIINLIRKYANGQKIDIMISKEHYIEKDSLGNKEARFFILNNKVINSSRYICKLKHSVPKSLRKTADEFVEKIAMQNYSANYVLDLGYFRDGDDTFIDIVEVNPITPSYCYVNNSIFEECVPEIETLQEATRYGYEYAFDYLDNPDKYELQRDYNRSYELLKENRYFFSE